MCGDMSPLSLSFIRKTRVTHFVFYGYLFFLARVWRVSEELKGRERDGTDELRKRAGRRIGGEICSFSFLCWRDTSERDDLPSSLPSPPSVGRLGRARIITIHQFLRDMSNGSGVDIHTATYTHIAHITSLIPPAPA